MDVVYSYRRSPYKYTQFVHVSGVAFAQVMGGTQGFLFLTNRLMAPGRGGSRSGNRFKSGGTGKTDHMASVLREQLEEFCWDREKLEKFYEEMVRALPSAPVGAEEPPPLSI